MRALRISLIPLLALTGCGYDRSDPPVLRRAARIQRHFSELVIETDWVSITKRGSDLSYFVIEYSTRVSDAATFWAGLTEAALEREWSLVHRDEEYREFHRVYSEGETVRLRFGQGLHATIEIARVAYEPASRRVRVGYAQLAMTPVEYSRSYERENFENRVFREISRSGIAAREGRAD